MNLQLITNMKVCLRCTPAAGTVTMQKQSVHCFCPTSISYTLCVCARETESHKLLCCIIYLCGRLSPSLSFFKRLTFRINERVALVASFTGGKDE